MQSHGIVRRVGVCLGVALVLMTLQGCTYMKNRGDDALQVADIGLTFSNRPYLSAYVCGFGAISFGAGSFDGHFLGWGGDAVSWQRLYHRDIGLGPWSYSEIGWGDSLDPQKPETLEQWYAGLIGWFQHPPRRPAYGVACVHYLHLGWFGFVGNLRYAEMIDFLTGWVGYDFCGDDGKKFREEDWPWWKDNPREGPVYYPDLPF